MEPTSPDYSPTSPSTNNDPLTREELCLDSFDDWLKSKWALTSNGEKLENLFDLKNHLVGHPALSPLIIDREGARSSTYDSNVHTPLTTPLKLSRKVLINWAAVYEQLKRTDSLEIRELSRRFAILRLVIDTAMRTYTRIAFDCGVAYHDEAPKREAAKQESRNELWTVRDRIQKLKAKIGVASIDDDEDNCGFDVELAEKKLAVLLVKEAELSTVVNIGTTQLFAGVCASVRICRPQSTWLRNVMRKMHILHVGVNYDEVPIIGVAVRIAKLMVIQAAGPSQACRWKVVNLRVEPNGTAWENLPMGKKSNLFIGEQCLPTALVLRNTIQKPDAFTPTALAFLRWEFRHDKKRGNNLQPQVYQFNYPASVQVSVEKANATIEQFAKDWERCRAKRDLTNFPRPNTPKFEGASLPQPKPDPIAIRFGYKITKSNVARTLFPPDSFSTAAPPTKKRKFDVIEEVQLPAKAPRIVPVTITVEETSDEEETSSDESVNATPVNFPVEKEEEEQLLPSSPFISQATIDALAEDSLVVAVLKDMPHHE